MTGAKELNPHIVQKNFHSTGIDLFKLKQTKEWSTILRMVRVSNDISLAPGISFIASFRPPSAHLDVIKNGIDWHLLRWNSAVAAEAISNVIEPLQKYANDPSHEIWILIRNSPILSKLWTELEVYLKDGKHNSRVKSAKFVRDKLLAHYDPEPLEKAFESLLDAHIAAGQPEGVIGWHVQTVNDGGQLNRNNFVDQLVNIAWYQAYGITVSTDRPDSKAIQAVADELEEFLSLVARFVHQVMIDYCEKHDLINIDIDPPWIQEDRAYRG